MTHYYQGDLNSWEEEYEMTDEDKEVAEDIALEIMSQISEYSLEVQFAALWLAQEMLDHEDREQIDMESTQGINGVEYSS